MGYKVHSICKGKPMFCHILVISLSTYLFKMKMDYSFCQCRLTVC